MADRLKLELDLANLLHPVEHSPWWCDDYPLQPHDRQSRLLSQLKAELRQYRQQQSSTQSPKRPQLETEVQQTALSQQNNREGKTHREAHPVFSSSASSQLQPAATDNVNSSFQDTQVKPDPVAEHCDNSERQYRPSYRVNPLGSSSGRNNSAHRHPQPQPRVKMQYESH